MSTILSEAIREVKEEMKSGFDFHKKRIGQKYQERGFRRAVELAIGQNRTDGKTYYVLKGRKGYIYFNSDQFKDLKRKGWFSKRVSIVDVVKQASYIERGSTNQKPRKQGFLVNLLRWIGWM